jgi:hypothetical protein
MIGRAFNQAETGPSRWQVDAGLVAKLLCVLPAIVSCLSAVPQDQMEAAVTRLLPFCLLLIRHTQVSYCTLMVAAFITLKIRDGLIASFDGGSFHDSEDQRWSCCIICAD